MQSCDYVVENILSDKFLQVLLSCANEEDIWLVGGYLRDLFLGRTSLDRDIVCLNDPKDLALTFAQKTGGTFIELDSENKIYRVVLEDKENYFDISKALMGDIEKDARRRDFTLNSLFFNLRKKEFYDPTDAICAIKCGILKTYSHDNFKDDPLRMLRAFRFISTFNFKLDEDDFKFIEENKKDIQKCAKERVNQELVKLFEGDYFDIAIRKADEAGFLSEIFPFVDEIKKIPPNTHHHLNLFEHSLMCARTIRTKNPYFRIAAFCHDIGKPSTHTIEPTGRHRFIGHDEVGAKLIKPILTNLKFSNKQIEYISSLIKNHIYPSALMSSEDVQDKAKIRFVKKLHPYVRDVIELARADRLCARGPMVSDEMVEANLNNLKLLLEFYENIEPRLEKLPKLLDGVEIMQILNIKPSRKLGEVIEALSEAQLEKKVNTKEEAVEFIKSFCKEM